jgi:hypothetical protein
MHLGGPFLRSSTGSERVGCVRSIEILCKLKITNQENPICDPMKNSERTEEKGKLERRDRPSHGEEKRSLLRKKKVCLVDHHMMLCSSCES